MTAPDRRLSGPAQLRRECARAGMPKLALASILDRQVPAALGRRATKAPWHDSAFSQRMRGRALSQEHDRASRRGDDRRAGPLGRRRKGSARPRPGAVRPGLYLQSAGPAELPVPRHPTSRPPPSGTPRTVASADGLDCNFDQADLLQADIGPGDARVLLLLGQANVFPRPEVGAILNGAHAVLAPGGAGAADARRRARR